MERIILDGLQVNEFLASVREIVRSEISHTDRNDPTKTAKRNIVRADTFCKEKGISINTFYSLAPKNKFVGAKKINRCWFVDSDQWESQFLAEPVDNTSIVSIRNRKK